MKKLTVCLLALSLLCLLGISVSAETEATRLIDGADLLSESQETKLIARIDDIRTEFEYDIVIVTTETYGTKTPFQFTKDAFESGNYGMGENGSGVILTVSIKDRQWYIEFFGDSKLPEGTAMSEYFVDDLKSGDYYDAFSSFAEATYDELRFSFGSTLLICLVIGFVIAFIVTSVMKSKLKSVHYQNQAREYVRKGSFNLEQSRDLFLYSTVTRVARPKNTSSGGRSGGGGGSRGGGGSF